MHVELREGVNTHTGQVTTQVFIGFCAHFLSLSVWSHHQLVWMNRNTMDYGHLFNHRSCWKSLTIIFNKIFPDIDCILHPSVRATGDQSTEAVHGNELTESSAAGAQSVGATGTTQSQLLSVRLRSDIHRIRHQTVWIHWGGSDQVRA